MKIFITGIAGFLGSHIADSMLEKGHEVHGVDNLVGGYSDNVPAGANWRAVDCQYLSTMTNLTKGMDIVVHAACTAYEGLSVFSPQMVTQNTSQISATIFTAAVRNNVRRIVNCSSMARYGIGDMPFNECQEPMPNDPYAIAKVAAESLLFNMGETHGFEVVNLVPHNIVGPRQKYDDPFRNVVSIMANRMLQGNPPIIYGDGEQTRCYSDIRDVVSCFDAAILTDVAVGKTVNIGPDEEIVSINDLAFIMRTLCEFDGDPIYFPDRPREVKHASCSSALARRLFHYETKHSLIMTCQSIVDYIKTRGVKPFQYHLPIEIEKGAPRTWTERLI
jgi:UDP-glucose 4-epimerase